MAGAEKKMRIENDVPSPSRGEDQDCGGIYLPLRTNRSYRLSSPMARPSSFSAKNGINTTSMIKPTTKRTQLRGPENGRYVGPPLRPNCRIRTALNPPIIDARRS